MDLESDGTQIQAIQKKMDTLLSEVNEMRKQLSETESRLEIKIGNLRAEFIPLMKEFRKNNERLGVINEDLIDLENSCSIESFDGNSQNMLAQNDTDQDKQTDAVPLIKKDTEPDQERDMSISPNRRSRTHSIVPRRSALHRAPSIVPRRSPLNRVTSSITRHSPDPSKIESLHTSSSFHMYSAATISDPSNSCAYVWSIAFISLMITISQMFFLISVSGETSLPFCLSHEDCRTGEFCSFDIKNIWKTTPRCVDCGYVTYNSECSSVLDKYEDLNHQDVGDHMDIAWKFNFDYTETERDCFAQSHCDQTDLLHDQCDFLVFNSGRWHTTQRISLIFMSLLFAVLISRDVQDALVEEAYLNHGLKNNEINPSNQLAAEVLRMTLRARQIIIPWYAAAAAIGIIISESISAENIMLNLLTIDIILVADDMLATLFLPFFDQSSTDKLEASAASANVEISAVRSRIYGMIVASTLVLTIYFFRDLMKNQKPWKGCTATFVTLIFWLIIIFPICTILLHGAAHVAKDKTSITKCMAVQRGFGEMILDSVSFLFFASSTSYFYAALTFQESLIFEFSFRYMVFVALGITSFLTFMCFKFTKLYTSWQSIHRLNAHLFGN